MCQTLLQTSRTYRIVSLWQVGFDPFQIRCMSDGCAIVQQCKPCAFVIPAAGLVPDYAESSAAVEHVVQTEEIPLTGRHEGIHLHRVVGLRSNADQPVDDQIAIGRMVVMTAALQVVPKPLAGLLIEIFADVGLSILVLRFGIRL
jgi:hypothetical protein